MICPNCGNTMRHQGIPARCIDAQTGEPTGQVSYWHECRCIDTETGVFTKVMEYKDE